MQNHGILSCIGLDVPQNENEKLILSFLSKNRHFKGYICPLYSKTAVEEIEEDGSAIVEFKTSSNDAWDIAVSIFEKCGYPVLISRNKKTFGTIIADSELDVSITNTKPFFWKTLRKQMSESESESESEDEAEEEVAEEIADEAEEAEEEEAVVDEAEEEVAEEIADEAEEAEEEEAVVDEAEEEEVAKKEAEEEEAEEEEAVVDEAEEEEVAKKEAEEEEAEEEEAVVDEAEEEEVAKKEAEEEEAEEEEAVVDEAEEEEAVAEEKSKPIKRRLRDSERQTPADFHTKFRQWPKPVLTKLSKRLGSITYTDDVRVSKNQILKELSEHCAKQTRAGVTLDLTRPK